jgi:hypothetical protein
MLRLLRSARKAYKQWRSLPVEDRERLRSHATHVKSLVGELLGPRGTSYLEGAHGMTGTSRESAPVSGRPQSEVLAELKDATAAFVAALTTTANTVAHAGVPNSVRLSGRLARAGARRASRGLSAESPAREEGASRGSSMTASDDLAAGPSSSAMATDIGLPSAASPQPRPGTTMDLDGGLQRAMSKLQIEASASRTRLQADEEVVTGALAEQRLRLRAAIAAFESEVKRANITPEQFIVRYRRVEPESQARFRNRPVLGWGSRSEPVPTDPEYEAGFTLYAWDTPHGDRTVGQSVILCPPERIRFHNSSGARTMYPDIPEGVLPFHVGDDGELRDGSTCGGERAHQLASISRTSDWFVNKLAAYLKDRLAAP